MYNGTNLDDTHDRTRLGLVSAANFSVVSPLTSLSKVQVREIAKHLGLSNWDAAPSPCLRSRLEFGVEATALHLGKVDKAEDAVRTALKLDGHDNLRVRILAGGRAAVELDGVDDDERRIDVRGRLVDRGVEAVLLDELQFKSWIVRPFKSGGNATEINIDDKLLKQRA